MPITLVDDHEACLLSIEPCQCLGKRWATLRRQSAGSRWGSSFPDLNWTMTKPLVSPIRELVQGQIFLALASAPPPRKSLLAQLVLAWIGFPDQLPIRFR